MIKTLGSLPGAMIANKMEKTFGRGRIRPDKVQPNKKKSPIMQVDYKMHGGKVHYKPGGGMVMDDMSKVMMKMHGGKIHDAKYYQKGNKVAGCGPARNKPNMTKKA